MKPRQSRGARKVDTMKWLLTLCLMTAFGCAVEAEPIHFGQDACHFCKMTIVERQFAAQCVTRKGKQFKYDAIECMVHELRAKGNEAEMGLLKVSDYAGGPMIDATRASYLISPKIKSPMGAFLSAFASPQEASRAQQEHGGSVYNWQGLKEKLASDSP